jgi:hypothetical protein
MFDELDKDEIEHDPFEFPHDDKIPFSRLLFDSTIWQVQGLDNGDANMSMPLSNDYIQVSDVPPQVVHVPMAPNQHTPMQSMGSMEAVPLINSKIPLIQIIILKSYAQQTIINTLDIQMDPFVNPPNIVINNIRDITLEQNVGHIWLITQVHFKLWIHVLQILKL